MYIYIQSPQLRIKTYPEWMKNANKLSTLNLNIHYKSNWNSSKTMAKTQIDPSCNGRPFTNHHRHICKPHDGAAVVFSLVMVYIYSVIFIQLKTCAQFSMCACAKWHVNFLNTHALNSCSSWHMHTCWIEHMFLAEYIYNCITRFWSILHYH